MSHTAVKAIPQTYRGVRFRSTLEADWAATLDSLEISWQYEPEAVQLPSGGIYRPDFYLPQCETWLEVKGPHNDRIEKVHELGEAAAHYPDCDRIVHVQAINITVHENAQARDTLQRYERAIATAPDGETSVTVKLVRWDGATAVEANHQTKTLRTMRARRPIALNPSTMAELGRSNWSACCEGYSIPWRMVVIGRAATAGMATWESAQHLDIYIIKCSQCGKHSFFDSLMQWICRRCRSDGKVYEGGSWESGSGSWSFDTPWTARVPFAKAPRACR